MEKEKHMKERVLYYWLCYGFTYVFPFIYFFIKLGITKQATKVVMPVVIIGMFAVIKLASDIPKWVSTWQPSFKKGIIKAIPKFLMFMMLITFGLTLKYVLEKQIEVAFFTYFETVLVLFGGGCIGSIFGAYHLKFKELDLIAKGYVLGVINH